MWMLFSASASATTFGLGASYTYDVPGPSAVKTLAPDDDYHGCSPENGISGACSEGYAPDKDATFPISLALKVPVRVPLSSVASLRVDPFLSFSAGKSRATCPAGSGECFAYVIENEDGTETPFSDAPGDSRMIVSLLPMLGAALGPEIRFLPGKGAQPYVAAQIGAAASYLVFDSDYFKEKYSFLLHATATASLGVQILPPSAGTGLYFELGYTGTGVQATAADTGEQKSKRQRDPFSLNGPHVDLGVLFGASR